MTTGPFSSTEVFAQPIQNHIASSYVGMSVAIMFIWDYGALTNYVVDRMTPLMLGSLSAQ
jgi:hypothetical protein